MYAPSNDPVLTKPNADDCCFVVSVFRPNQLILYSNFLAAPMALPYLSCAIAMVGVHGRELFIRGSRVGLVFPHSLSNRKTSATSSFKSSSKWRRRFLSASYCTSSGDIFQESELNISPAAAPIAYGKLTEEEKLLTKGIFCNTELSMKHITAVRLCIHTLYPPFVLFSLFMNWPSNIKGTF